MKYSQSCILHHPQVWTKPCSVPTYLKINDLDSSSVSVSWDEPEEVGEGVEITDYEVQVMQGEESTIQKKIIIIIEYESYTLFFL